MTSDIVRKLNDHEGQLLGLMAVLAAMLAHNPNLKLDETLVDMLIASWPIEGETAAADAIRAQAKAVTRSVLTEGRRK
jgi:hypothetical protein